MKKLNSTDTCLKCGGDLNWDTVDFDVNMIFQMGKCVQCGVLHYAEYPLKHIITVDEDGHEID